MYEESLKDLSRYEHSGLKEMDQLIIIYLFMKADGECSKEEIGRFNEICESKHVSDRDKQIVIDYCEKLNLGRNTDNSSKVINEINNILRNGYYQSNVHSTIDRKVEAFLIWTLMNLAYADDEYSQAEKNVINFLISCFDLDRSILDEFNDTIQTILRLSQQIEWIKTTDRGYDSINNCIKEYDENMHELYHNIEITISEANI